MSTTKEPATAALPALGTLGEEAAKIAVQAAAKTLQLS